ncbi:MAG: hypothetical protein MJE63_18205 [Proteobacteria bacterium]|nr:hypothetical protein [Pseudomonadota bacterium]
MSLELKFALFQLVIIIPFLAGNILGRLLLNLDRLARRLVIINLSILEPPIILWTVLGLSLAPGMIYLPISGAALALTGFLIGKGVAGRFHFGDKSSRVYVICSSLANQGFTMGGFICYLFAGERGLGLSNIFLMFFIPFTFLFIFGYASMEDRKEIFRWESIKEFLFNLRNMPLLAIVTAVGIRTLGFKRPEIYFPLDLLLTIAVAIYYFTLGINFKLSDLNPFKPEHLTLALQKFMILPALAFGITYFLPIGDDLKLIIKIESFMPVAVYAVVSSIMFDLDSRRASGLFVVNTLIFVILVFPVLFFMRARLF